MCSVLSIKQKQFKRTHRQSCRIKQSTILRHVKDFLIRKRPPLLWFQVRHQSLHLLHRVHKKGKTPISRDEAPCLSCLCLNYIFTGIFSEIAFHFSLQKDDLTFVCLHLVLHISVFWYFCISTRLAIAMLESVARFVCLLADCNRSSPGRVSDEERQ